jgi:hypothetical protein
LVKQNNEFYRGLVGQIQEQSKAEIVEIELPKPEKK